MKFQIFEFLLAFPRIIRNFEYLIVFTSAPGVLPEQNDRYRIRPWKVNEIKAYKNTQIAHTWLKIVYRDDSNYDKSNLCSLTIQVNTDKDGEPTQIRFTKFWVCKSLVNRHIYTYYSWFTNLWCFATICEYSTTGLWKYRFTILNGHKCTTS